MKNLADMTIGLSLLLSVVLLGAAGCSKTPKPDSKVLAGTWSGPDAAGTASLVFTGTNLEFHGADAREWYKASFVLREDTNPKQLVATITACPDPAYVGKTAYAIYQVQDGVFTIAAHEPGNPAVPASFDEQNVRKISFKQ